MKLRWITLYDANGLNGEKTLEQWNPQHQFWEPVPEYRYHKNDSNQYDPPEIEL